MPKRLMIDELTPDDLDKEVRAMFQAMGFRPRIEVHLKVLQSHLRQGGIIDSYENGVVNPIKLVDLLAACFRCNLIEPKMADEEGIRVIFYVA